MSRVTYHSTASPTMSKNPWVLHVLNNTRGCLHSGLRLFSQVRGSSSLFYLALPYWHTVWTIFPCAYLPSVYLVCYSFWPIFKSGCFLTVEFSEFFVFRITCPHRVCFLQIFSNSLCGSSSHSLDMVFRGE